MSAKRKPKVRQLIELTVGLDSSGYPTSVMRLTPKQAEFVISSLQARLDEIAASAVIAKIPLARGRR